MKNRNTIIVILIILFSGSVFTSCGSTNNELEKALKKSDMDNDSVYDYVDSCPDTPDGGIVDENGCTFAQLAYNPDVNHANKFEMKFNNIPVNNKFVMGSSLDGSELERGDDETQHSVIIGKTFYIQTTEVTQKQWQLVMNEKPSYFKDCPDCPVENVSWNKTQEFIAKLNQLGEGVYRLPTEAEWEYAARAGSITAFSNGNITEAGCDNDANLDKTGWYCYNSKETKPVMQKKPNIWGLYDIHGNVQEFCQDFYGEYHTGEVTDPAGPVSGDFKVIRGGSWDKTASLCRSAYRDKIEQDNSANNIGLRLVWENDSDGDGVSDGYDAFPFDKAEQLDTDDDGEGNNTDNDDDNDGVLDTNDTFPLDKNEQLDTDGDGIGDNADTDENVADIDGDSDGVTPADGDCNDSNPAIHPGATDIPNNGIDENCDGSNFEDPAFDYDRDGFPMRNDCNDNNASIRPNASEICDGIDNNCNNQTDEGLYKTAYYRDADNDNYGAGSPRMACTQPYGYVTNSTDCNDGKNNINPGATDIPDNGIDENCNGSDLVGPKYALTVSSGTGSSNYTAGNVVPITANTAPSGQGFDRWEATSGDPAPTIIDASASSTTLTMSASDTTVTAIYKELPPGTYTLTVYSGSGDGNYASGTNVTITADTAPTDQEFDKWVVTSGDPVPAIVDASASSTTLTMPASHTTVTATYKDLQYALTVNNGSGDGIYISSEDVTITADTAPADKEFDKWVVTSGDPVPIIDDASASSTTLTMSASDTTVTAIYKDLPHGLHTLTVESGGGNGDYLSGANVTITADTAPSDKEFDRWVVNSGNPTIANISASSTTLTMTASAATVTATYKNRQYTLTVNGGSGGGSYLSGSTVSIIANVAPEGHVFDYWEVNSGSPIILNINTSSTDLTMTANVAEITAKYNDLSLLDTDGDGVTDDIDDCPASQPGAFVDENGCVYYPHPLPDTGVWVCYDDEYNIADCSAANTPNGQDGHYNIHLPSYTKLDSNGNDLSSYATNWAMVRDNVTSLIWEVKTDDDDKSIHHYYNLYTWFDGNTGDYSDGANTKDFIDNLNKIEFGGSKQWRLPTVIELQSIVNNGRYDPSIDSNYFPNTEMFSYWSSTTNASDKDYAWSASFTLGDSRVSNMSTPYHVRAVRGEQSTSSFTDNFDGTTTDNNTGLIWMKATSDSAMNWEEALLYCEGLILDGKTDWRLPNIKELRSIVDRSKREPLLDNVYFTNSNTSDFWSSTTATGAPNRAARIHFYNGGTHYDYKSNSYHVRAVRGGQ